MIMGLTMYNDKKPIYKSIKVTNNTQVHRLPVIDQLKLLVSTLFNNESVKLEATEKISREDILMQSSLSNLVDTFISEMKEHNEKSVTTSISSRFKPYFDVVFSKEDGKGRFYDFIVEDKDMSFIGIDYYITVTISERRDKNVIKR